MKILSVLIAVVLIPSTPMNAFSPAEDFLLRTDLAEQEASTSISVNDVIEMVQAGLSEDLVIQRLRKGVKAFDLSASDMIRLKKAKVSDRVIEVMIDPNAGYKPSDRAVNTPSSADVPSVRLARILNLVKLSLAIYADAMTLPAFQA